MARSQEAKELPNHISAFRYIDKAGQLQKLKNETENINNEVNKYLRSKPNVSNRVMFLRASKIVKAMLIDTDVSILFEVPGASSSPALYNELCMSPNVEHLMTFIESLQLDIDAMYKFANVPQGRTREEIRVGK